jgi:hypothetical protein
MCSARSPARDTGTALVFPRANADAMQHHLEAISRSLLWLSEPRKLCVTFTLNYPG